MNVHNILVGLVLMVVIAGLYACMHWLVSDEQRLRRAAQQRWWIDRIFIKFTRRRGLSKEEWFAEWAAGARKSFRLIFRPLLVLWFCGGVFLVVQGIFAKS